MNREVETHPIKAVGVTIIYILLSVVSVFVLVNLVINAEPELEFLFENTIMYAAAIGIPMSVLAGLTAYFGPGDVYRLIFGVARVITSIVYFVVVLGSVNLGWEDEAFNYDIAMTGLMFLIIVGFALRIAYYITEYWITKDKLDSEAKGPVQVY
ncbi:MAG: hypothetical protein R6U61_03610 [Thermoplasmata archaeon]